MDLRADAIQEVRFSGDLVSVIYLRVKAHSTYS